MVWDDLSWTEHGELRPRLLVLMILAVLDEASIEQILDLTNGIVAYPVLYQLERDGKIESRQEAEAYGVSTSLPSEVRYRERHAQPRFYRLVDRSTTLAEVRRFFS